MPSKKNTSKRSTRSGGKKTREVLSKAAIAVNQANLARIEAVEKNGKKRSDVDRTSLAEFFPHPGTGDKKRNGRMSTSAAKADGAAKTNAKAPKPQKQKRMSGLDAAAKVLSESKEPLNTVSLVKIMAEKGLWSSPGGKTPASTLHAAISREINVKGKDSRFKKADRGLFAASTSGGAK
jgi:hypothetical protein